MDARWGWALAALAVGLGWWQWGWPGVVLGVTVVVFWLLLQFSRSLRVMQKAGAAPLGQVANAVMFHSRLRQGLTLLQVLPLAGSLGRRPEGESQAAGADETFIWADAAGDQVALVLRGGRLQQWTLTRAAGAASLPDHDGTPGADAAP